MDIVDSVTRSRMMSGIRNANTKPELLIRSLLHKKGFRFRLHQKNLPGKPDLVLTKYHAVVFVHGCFWHGHHCPLFKLPATRRDFWKNKIEQNQLRDSKHLLSLKQSGWRVGIIWECAVRGKKRDITTVANQLAVWLESENPFFELSL